MVDRLSRDAFPPRAIPQTSFRRPLFAFPVAWNAWNAWNAGSARTAWIAGIACAVVLALGVPSARAQCTALSDPIPGAIALGPFTVTLENAATGLVWPVDVTAPDDETGRLFVTLREGKIVVVDGGTVLPTPMLDISATTVINSGSAMSSIALHPEFSSVGQPGEGLLYTISQEEDGTAPAHFGDPVGASHQSVVYEWRVSDTDPNVVDTATKREILRIDETSKAHNADELVFGPDGMLHLAKGDDDATASVALDGTTIHGNVLRIDVDDPSGNGRYSIPPDNPFVGGAGGKLPEVWAYGFRNPWRAGFDRNNGKLWIADIGEDDIEEIDDIVAGGGYGWIEKEGSFVFLDFDGVTNDASCLPQGFESIDPVAEYDHSEGDNSITGGFVYRGTAMPELRGHYVFGDWISGRLMHMVPGEGVVREIAIDANGATLGSGTISFGEDADGELLAVVTPDEFTPGGRVVRFVSVAATPPADPPGVPEQSVTVGKLDPAGAALAISWDIATCAPDARSHRIVYGFGADLPTTPGQDFAVAGGVCDVGASTPFHWDGVPDPTADPSGLLWFLVVADDAAGVEGAWGTGSGDVERGGPGAGGGSGVCGAGGKSLANACGAS